MCDVTHSSRVSSNDTWTTRCFKNNDITHDAIICVRWVIRRVSAAATLALHDWWQIHMYIYDVFMMSLNYRSLLQNIVSFVGRFCKRDLWFSCVRLFMMSHIWIYHTYKFSIKHPMHMWICQVFTNTYDKFICALHVLWQIHMCDKFICVTWLIRHASATAILPSPTQSIPVTCVTWHIHTCDMTHSCVRHAWGIHGWVTSHICHLYMSHDSSAVDDCFDTWHMTHLCVTWLINMYAVMYSYVWHDSFMCATNMCQS